MVIGRIDANGTVLDDRGAVVGRVTADGTVHRGTGTNPIGRVDPSGGVYEQGGYQQIATVDDNRSGAAFLLMLR